MEEQITDGHISHDTDSLGDYQLLVEPVGIIGGVGKANNNRSTSSAMAENGYVEQVALVTSIDISETDIAASSNRFPKEPHKFVVAVALVFAAAVANDVALAYAHELLPRTPPLPDVVFRHSPNVPWALAASEYIILASLSFTLLLCLFHKYRWILLRRLVTISSVLYFGRAICVLVTQVPVADPTYYCAPKLNRTDVATLFGRAWGVVRGAGLNINGKHTLCGDYIYSGHTLMLVLAYLFTKEYSPRRWWWLHWSVWVVSATGVVFLLLSRGHYTVDVIIAYWVSTRVFWIYHAMATNLSLKECSATNHMSRLCWFPLFRYMEANVGGVVPRRFEWPLVWPLLPRRNGKVNCY